jgi:hypothetical protein
MATRDEEGYDPNISYQEGAGYVGPGGQVTNYVPTAPVGTPAPDTSLWQHAVNQNTGFNYTPQQLGWDPAAAQRFTDAGISNLPQWMNTTSLYSPEFHRGSGDFVQSYIDLYNTPLDQATNNWTGADKAKKFLVGSGGSVDDPDFREAYLRTSLGHMYNARDSWWDRNEGLVMGVGGVASIAGGAALGGFGLAGEAAAGVGEAGAVGAGGSAGLSGLEIGADLGYSAAQLAPGGIQGGIAGGSASAGSWLGDAILSGQAAGADVGMGAGTSWLTDMGLPASYGNDLGALLSYSGDTLGGLDWSKLGGNVLSKLLSGGGLTGTPAGGGGVAGGGGAGGTPQTSAIAPNVPVGAGQPIAPATMPTGSIMSAFGQQDNKPDYRKYFSTLF